MNLHEAGRRMFPTSTSTPAPTPASGGTTYRERGAPAPESGTGSALGGAPLPSEAGTEPRPIPEHERKARTLFRSEHYAEMARDAQATFGAELPAHVERARAVLDHFGDPEVADAIAASGLGNHRAVIRLLSKIGERLGLGSDGQV